MELVAKCRCNKCMEVYMSDNMGKNTLLPYNGEPELQYLEDEEGGFMGCPVCETDHFLMDL